MNPLKTLFLFLSTARLRRSARPALSHRADLSFPKANVFGIGRVACCLALIVSASACFAAPKDDEQRAARLAAADKALAQLKREIDVQKHNPVVLSLAGMAYMASGTTPAKGLYRSELNQIITKLGRLGDGGAKDQSWYFSFASLALCEAHAASPDRRLKEAIARHVDVLQSNQRQDGGWSHRLQGPGSKNYFRDGQFTAASLPALIALGYARMEGVEVEQRVIARATDFLERSVNLRTGNVGYDPNNGSTSPGRTAAGVVALLATGQNGHERLPEMTDYMLKRAKASINGHGSALINVLECAMGHHVAGDDAWAGFMKAVGNDMLKSQKEDGSFPAFPGDKVSGGSSFDKGLANTAACAIILLLPEDNLPLLSRLRSTAKLSPAQPPIKPEKRRR